jgi:outer membrane protein assembly factor BamB
VTTYRLRRSVLALTIVAGALAVLAPPAMASGTSIALRPKVGPPTTTAKVTGKGFGASETIGITFDQTTVASGASSPSGGFTARFKVPKSATPGEHTVTATGESSGLMAQATFAVRTDWTRFRFDPSNSGDNPYENVLGASNVSTLTQRWSTWTGDGRSSPAVVHGVVYVGGTSEVLAFNATTGARLWHRDMGNGVSSPAVADGMVYIGDYDGTVRALKASNGKPVWTFTTGGPVTSSPVVVNGAVYVGSWDHNVYSLNASTGASYWTYPTGGDVESSPAVVGGAVYVGSDDHSLYSIDAGTGESNWSFPAGGAFSSSPAVVGGVVYVGSMDYNVYALNASTGNKVWSYQTGESIESSPAVANGIVYVGSDDTLVYALKASTGHKLWTFATTGIVQSSPVAANGVVYVGSSQDRYFYALDASSGAKLWSFDTFSFGWVDSSAAVSDGVLYVNTENTNLYAFGLP